MDTTEIGVDLAQLMATAQSLITEFGVKILAAIAIFLVGKWIARRLANGVRRLMERGTSDPMLVRFVGNIIYFGLLTFVILAAIAQLGVQTTSFIAVLGAAGFAIGLALQGSLANFAAGVLILVFRPFKVGDYIEGAGVAGTVEALHIFTTTLTTPDHKTIIIPNGDLSSGTIVNYSTKPTRRVDLVFGVSYDDDIDTVKRLLEDEVAKDPRILKDPPTTIALSELADSSVNFVCRPWVASADYWGVYFGLQEAVKKRFDEEGISIPYPQQDVHIVEHRKADA